jgi:hypothetical protein
MQIFAQPFQIEGEIFFEGGDGEGNDALQTLAKFMWLHVEVISEESK